MSNQQKLSLVLTDDFQAEIEALERVCQGSGAYVPDACLSDVAHGVDSDAA